MGQNPQHLRFPILNARSTSSLILKLISNYSLTIAMSDSSFDDDDDMFLELLKNTQAPRPIPQPPQRQFSTPPQNLPQTHTASQPQANPAQNANLNHELQLFQAQGEILILRAQLQALQALKSEEIQRLTLEFQNSSTQAQGHIAALKQSVDKLEDEKKFLGNEIRSLSAAKRRKISANDKAPATDIDVSTPAASFAERSTSASTRPRNGAEVVAKPKIAPVIRVLDDWSLVCLHLWSYTINGSKRTTMEFLSRICVDSAVDGGSELKIEARTPILAAVWNYLLLKKDARLDQLVFQFSQQIMSLVEILLSKTEKLPGFILPVPFLVSLVHACVNFKVSAVDEKLVQFLVQKTCDIMKRLVSLLRLSEDEEESFSDDHSVTYQHRLLENFTLVLTFDLLEDAMTIASQFGPQFVAKLWALDAVSAELLNKILPENSERFKSATQINLVYNYVEMLSASLVEGGFATNNVNFEKLLVSSLIKVFLIDIPIKDDFMFFGLNRSLGNNGDFGRISNAIPEKPDSTFSHAQISIAFPVKPPDPSEKSEYLTLTSHEHHLLSLRVRIVNLLESLVISGCMHLLNQKENIKSLVRIIAFEQNTIMHQPRSQFVHMRLTIVAVLLRVLYYITDEHKNINNLIYPETLYEIFVILMRIAFGSDSLLFDAQKLLTEIRAQGITDPGIFNRWCESRSREIAHINLHDARPSKYSELGNAECDFANGLEFPYELETIEIAREILGLCVNHDEADNLYYNMNCEA